MEYRVYKTNFVIAKTGILHYVLCMTNKYLTILATAILLINLSFSNTPQDKANHGKTDGYNSNQIKIVDI